MRTFLLMALMCLGLVRAASAADITPTFAGAPAGWTTDRYQPDSFGVVGGWLARVRPHRHVGCAG